MPLLVVGRVVLPVLDNNAPGDGAAFSEDGLERVATETESTFVVRYTPGVDVASLERRLRDEYALDADIVYARPQPPGLLTNLHEVGSMLPAMAAFFAALGLLGLVHALVMSSRGGRRESGVLSALGMRRRQLVGIVVWQSVIVVLAGLMIGGLVGILIGHRVWQVSVSDLGMLGGSSIPIYELGVLVAASVTTALVLGWLIGRHAAIGRQSEVLQTE